MLNEIIKELINADEKITNLRIAPVRDKDKICSILNDAINKINDNADALVKEAACCIGIWQYKDEYKELLFEGIENLIKYHSLKSEDELTREKYKLIFIDTEYTDDLNEIYIRYNLTRKEGYLGHSLSVGDIIMLKKKDEKHFYFVDSFGFKELKKFMVY